MTLGNSGTHYLHMYNAADSWSYFRLKWEHANLGPAHNRYSKNVLAPSKTKLPHQSRGMGRATEKEIDSNDVVPSIKPKLILP